MSDGLLVFSLFVMVVLVAILASKVGYMKGYVDGSQEARKAMPPPPPKPAPMYTTKSESYLSPPWRTP